MCNEYDDRSNEGWKMLMLSTILVNTIRERNRVLARKTRLRKKSFFEVTFVEMTSMAFQSARAPYFVDILY